MAENLADPIILPPPFGDVARLLRVFDMLANSSIVEVRSKGITDISGNAVRVLEEAGRTDGFDPRIDLHIREVRIGLGKFSRNVVIAEARAGAFKGRPVHYVIDGPMLVGRQVIETPRDFGYRIDGERIIFEFELNASANIVTDDRTGLRRRIRPEEATHASIAGEFNGWHPEPMTPHARRLDIWVAERTRAELGDGPFQFKFVVEGNLWVEPPDWASNIARVEHEDTLNLVLTIPPRIPPVAG